MNFHIHIFMLCGDYICFRHPEIARIGKGRKMWDKKLKINKPLIKNTSTWSTSSLEQLKQTHLNTLTICAIKPTWNTGLANSKCPKWPGHSIWLPLIILNNNKYRYKTSRLICLCIYLNMFDIAMFYLVDLGVDPWDLLNCKTN